MHAACLPQYTVEICTMYRNRENGEAIKFISIYVYILDHYYIKVGLQAVRHVTSIWFILYYSSYAYCKSSLHLFTKYLLTIQYYNYRELLGKDQSHNGLSLANKFVMALISANLYSPKQKVKEDTLNK